MFEIPLANFDKFHFWFCELIFWLVKLRSFDLFFLEVVSYVFRTN